jgi:hypothetical protein
MYLFIRSLFLFAFAAFYISSFLWQYWFSLNLKYATKLGFYLVFGKFWYSDSIGCFSWSIAQIPAFYMDTSHLFNTQHARLAPPSLAQQQGFQPGLSQVNIKDFYPVFVACHLYGFSIFVGLHMLGSLKLELTCDHLK